MPWYQPYQVAKTKYPRLGGLNNRNMFSHSNGDSNSKIRVLAELVSGEASLPVW